jgi:hypothetical protein
MVTVRIDGFGSPPLLGLALIVVALAAAGRLRSRAAS